MATGNVSHRLEASCIVAASQTSTKTNPGPPFEETQGLEDVTFGKGTIRNVDVAAHSDKSNHGFHSEPTWRGKTHDNAFREVNHA